MPLLPPHLGDKLVDWQLLAAAGGMELLIDKNVLELGPSYGLDVYAFTPYAKSYVVVESAPDVLAHLESLRHAVWLQTARVNPPVIIKHNLQLPIDKVADGGYDLVIDFGTIDNVLGGYLPYREAARVLKPGGVLLTTYANWAHFKTDKSPSGDEVRLHPEELAHELSTMDLEVYVRLFEDQPRAAMAARKRELQRPHYGA